MPVQKYSISADRKYVLLGYGLRPRNTYSFRAKYKVYNTASAQISQLKVKNMANENEVVDEFDHVQFGPKGDQLVSRAYANKELINSSFDHGFVGFY